MRRLQFSLEQKAKIPQKKLLKMSFADVLDDDRHFVITVDADVFFDDPYFPIREFAIYALKWIKKADQNFIYETKDDYQNPLLAFSQQENGWKVQSVWQKFECETEFSFTEVKSFIESIINQVIKP